MLKVQKINRNYFIMWNYSVYRPESELFILRGNWPYFWQFKKKIHSELFKSINTFFGLWLNMEFVWWRCFHHSPKKICVLHESKKKKHDFIYLFIWLNTESAAEIKQYWHSTHSFGYVYSVWVYTNSIIMSALFLLPHWEFSISIW